MENAQIKILVVDDNPATLYSTSRILKSAAYEVLQAVDGKTALDLVDQCALVVLDIDLPDIDGYEVCRKIRANPDTKRIPVVHLSATFVSGGDRVFGLDSGADGYLTHPVEPPVLVATVNAFLRARKAEEGMRKSDATFRAIFENALNGISLLTKDLVFVEANPSLCHLLLRDRDDIVGKALSIFVPIESLPQLNEISTTLETAKNWQGSFPLLSSNGSLVELDWNISIHSEPDVHLAIVNDITDKRRGEREREKLLESERSARAEAEKANQLKDEFLATLSHELRTPLNVIVGWSQILSKEPDLSPRTQAAVKAIQGGARAQAELISDLLDASRIISGKLRLDIKSVNPVSIINSSLQTLMPSIEAKAIEIVTNLDSDAGEIYADSSRLEQVIWNLITNAVKFTPKGGKIELELQSFEHAVDICVKDSGQGIDPKVLPFIFDRFRQGDASTTREHGGLGLGLAISKNLVELHGGEIAVESPGVGKGTTFTIHLLRNAFSLSEVERSAIPDTSYANISLGEFTNLAGIRVLVIDDDKGSRELIHRILQDCDAIVSSADSKAQALKQITEFCPHILVSDIGMPGGDGYELISAVRQLGFTPEELPAIALTAFARVEDRDQALRAGYQMHLAKPLDPISLTLLIANIVGAQTQVAA